MWDAGKQMARAVRMHPRRGFCPSMAWLAAISCQLLLTVPPLAPLPFLLFMISVGKNAVQSVWLWSQKRRAVHGIVTWCDTDTCMVIICASCYPWLLALVIPDRRLLGKCHCLNCELCFCSVSATCSARTAVFFFFQSGNILSCFYLQKVV